MKRGASDTGSGASPGHPAKLHKACSSSEQDNGGNDGKSLLHQQNHELAVDMRRRKRQEAELEKKLAQAWAKQGHYEATLSAVNRAWAQVLSDLNTAAVNLGLGPRPLHVTVEEGELELSVKDGLPDVATEGGGTVTELSIMSKLLMPAAEVLAMDATDFACGDTLLKETNKNPGKAEGQVESTRELKGGMAGTSSAFYDLDSDGYGLSSRENIKRSGAPEIAEVENGLSEKARFTAELAGRLFQALQAHLMSLPPESRKTTLDARQLEELGCRRRLETERLFLSDQLTQARKRCIELSESITGLREDCRKANRTLDKLAEDGIELPSNTRTSAWVGRGSQRGTSTGPSTPGRISPGFPGSGLGGMKTEGGLRRGGSSPGDSDDLIAALEEAQALSESRLKQMERARADKAETERAMTRLTASTELDPQRHDLSGHPQFQRLSTQLEAEQDMLKLERTRVAELEGQIKQMSAQVEQHEMALHQQMEQQRLRWKSEIVSSTGMLHTVTEDLEKAQAKLRHEARVAPDALRTATVAKDESERLLRQTEQQVSILKASLERATRAKEHAEAQAAKDRARLDRQGTGASGGGREDEHLRAKLTDVSRQLEGSKTIQDALQSELNTTLAAYAQSKEGNQKLIQEMTRINHNQKDLSDEITSAKAQVRNRQQVRATMELQVKTAAQMRDQGHALKQKALDLVAEAERKLQQERAHNLQLTREVHTEKAHADRARQEVDALTQTKQAVENAHRGLKEHCERLNERMVKLDEDEERAKDQVGTLMRKLEKARSQNARLVEQVKESINLGLAAKKEDNEMRDAELAELRKMIKCSVCQDKKKNRVITKCYHMFCDGCLEKSIKSRNRKCPACTKAYGSDDVHELWLT